MRSDAGTAAARPLNSRFGGCGEELTMDPLQEGLLVLDETLSLGGRARAFTRETHLLGAITELDAMAAVGVVTSLEERSLNVNDDDDIDGSPFATVGSLADFVSIKLGR